MTIGVEVLRHVSFIILYICLLLYFEVTHLRIPSMAGHIALPSDLGVEAVEGASIASVSFDPGILRNAAVATQTPI